ncbi:MAG: hypothetical protein P0120_13175 [Nitrospira sp.]|nr:hypothetical protein [Nitrospira sp.]
MSNRIESIPHIGIVAGTADGAALCYRTLCLLARAALRYRVQEERHSDGKNLVNHRVVISARERMVCADRS